MSGYKGGLKWKGGLRTTSEAKIQINQESINHQSRRSKIQNNAGVALIEHTTQDGK